MERPIEILLFILMTLPLYGQVYRSELGDSTAAIRADFPAGGSSDTTHHTTIPKVIALQDSLDDKLNRGEYSSGISELSEDTSPQLGGNLDLNGSEILFAGGSSEGITDKTSEVTVTKILDEDDMASDDRTALATQQSIKAYVDALEDSFKVRNMIGSDNATWVVSGYAGYNSTGAPTQFRSAYNFFGGTGGAQRVSFNIVMPSQIGDYDLHITGIRYHLYAADANDYVDYTYIYGYDGSPVTQVYSDTGNETSSGEKNSGDELTALSDTDMSGYRYVSINLGIYVTTANHLYFTFPEVQIYYKYNP